VVRALAQEERDRVPQDPDDGEHHGREDRREHRVVEVAAQEAHDAADRDAEEDRPCDGETARDPKHPPLDAALPGDAVKRRGRDEADRCAGRGQKRDEEQQALPVAERPERLGEGDREHEPEEHLHPGKRDPKLVQELDELAVLLGVPSLGLLLRRAIPCAGHPMRVQEGLGPASAA